ncbi:MAG: hypothetical protein MRY57_01375 [Candidatus Pacebacteria bacterium]|nr:hypothetical protein [Candidatus Paceibacterota bacterium]
MKKSLIAIIATVLAGFIATFLGGQDINLDEQQIEEFLVQAGEEFLISESADNQTISSVNIHDIAWASGDFESQQQNLYHHYEKHKDSVSVSSVQEYYNAAIMIINNENTIIIKDFYCDGCTDYFDDENDYLVGLNPYGSINTFHQVSKLKERELKEYLVKE